MSEQARDEVSEAPHGHPEVMGSNTTSWTQYVQERGSWSPDQDIYFIFLDHASGQVCGMFGGTDDFSGYHLPLL